MIICSKSISCTLVVDNVSITMLSIAVRVMRHPTDSAMCNCNAAPVARYRSRSLSISVNTSRTAAVMRIATRRRRAWLRRDAAII